MLTAKNLFSNNRSHNLYLSVGVHDSLTAGRARARAILPTAAVLTPSSA